MKRGIADAIAYVKNLLGLVRQEPVPPLRIEPTPPVLVFDEDISPNVGHFDFNKRRASGGQINTEFYDAGGELLD